MKSILLSLLIFPMVVFSQENEQTKIETHINSVIHCFNTKDDSAYAELASLDIFLIILKEKVDTDDSGKSKFMVELFESKPEQFKLMFSDNFKKLILDINKELDTKDWKVSYVSYQIRREENDSGVLHFTIDVSVLINGKKKGVTMYLSKYKGEYYLIEPIFRYLSDRN